MTSEDNSNVVLKAKIEWYREIHQIEPNSKLFLPFARHLAEVGVAENNPQLLNEAFDVLRQGLAFHPDFMEARLFLIELLNACDCKSQCGAEVARLASLFLSYPDFWDAWREHAISENESGDFAVALGFMSAILKDKSVSILQVLEAGLDSLRISARVSSPFKTQNYTSVPKNIAHTQETTETIEATEVTKNTADTLLKGAITPHHSAHTFVSHETITSIPTSLLPPSLPSDSLSPDSQVNQNTMQEVDATLKKSPTNEEFKAQIAQEADAVCSIVANAVLESALLNENIALNEGGAQIAGNIADIADIEGILPAPESHLNFANEPSIDISQDIPVEIATSFANDMEQVEPISLEVDVFEPAAFETHILENLESPEDDDELFMKEHFATYQDYAKKHSEEPQNTKEVLSALLADSSIVVQPMDKAIFKTRSMADILAEQGDLHGAIEIYEELIQKADHAERPLLEEHLKDLQDLAGIKSVDLSKLLAIDDMVDTSFGLMAQEESSRDNQTPRDNETPRESEDLENALTVQGDMNVSASYAHEIAQEDKAVFQESIAQISLDDDFNTALDDAPNRTSDTANELVREDESIHSSEQANIEMQANTSTFSDSFTDSLSDSFIENQNMHLEPDSSSNVEHSQDYVAQTLQDKVDSLEQDSLELPYSKENEIESLVLQELASEKVSIAEDFNPLDLALEEIRDAKRLEALEYNVQHNLNPSMEAQDVNPTLDDETLAHELGFTLDDAALAHESEFVDDGVIDKDKKIERIEAVDARPHEVSADLENVLSKFAKIEQEARSDLKASLMPTQRPSGHTSFDTPLDVAKISSQQALKDSMENAPVLDNERQIESISDFQSILDNEVQNTLFTMPEEITTDEPETIITNTQTPRAPSSATKDTENVVNLLSKLAERLEAKGTM